MLKQKSNDFCPLIVIFFQIKNVASFTRGKMRVVNDKTPKEMELVGTEPTAFSKIVKCE